MRPHTPVVLVLLLLAACIDVRPVRESLPRERRELARFATRHDAYRAALALELKSEAAPLWQSLGPQPSIDTNGRAASGRLTTIAISPADSRLILIGAAGGGIWRSDNAGETFVPVSDDQSDLSVASIAFAPGNPAVVYAAMRWDPYSAYDLGSGILRSVDGGRTWNRVASGGVAERAVNWRIAVDPTNANRVFLAQEYTIVADSSSETGIAQLEGGLYVSSDGGASWQRTLSGPMRDLALHPTNPQIVYAASAGQGPARIHRSSDGGATWAVVLTLSYPRIPASHIRITTTPAAPDRLYAVAGRSGNSLDLAISADRGLTWTTKPLDGVSAAQFDYNLAIAVSPVDPALVYVGTVPLYRSLDGGGSFERTFGSLHLDQQDLVFDRGVPDTLYIGNDGGLYRTTDEGRSFASLNMSLGVTQFYALGVDPHDARTMCGGTQDNGSQVHIAGSSWSTFADGDGGPCVINPLDPSVSAFLTKPSIIRRRTAGLNLTVATASTFSLDRTAPIPPLISNGVDDTLYFGTYRLYVGSQFGERWNAPARELDLTFGEPDVLRSIAVAQSNRDVIYTGSAQGRVTTSADGGLTWRDVSAGLPRRAITGIAIDPVDPTVAYVTLFAWSTGHVFATRDGGLSWRDISGNLPDTPANCIVLEPGNPATLYVGTDLGVFRSRSAGSWSYLRAGMPPAPVAALNAHPSGVIRAATYGRGVYEYVVGSERRRRASSQ